MTAGSALPGGSLAVEDRWRLVADGVLAGTVLLSELDFSVLGLASDDGVDVGRWILLFPVWFAPAAIVVLSRSLPALVRRSPLAWFVAWAMWATASALWSVTPRQSLLIGTAMITVVTFVALYTSRFGWDRFLRVSVAAALAYLAGGVLVESVLGGPPEADGRLTGLAFGPTGLGNFAATSLVLAVAAWSRGRDLLSGACAAASVACLALAEARGAAVSALVALVVVAGARLGAWRVLVGTLAGVAVLAAALSLGGGMTVVTRSGDAEELMTLTGRTDIWPIAVELAGERPVGGWGTGSSADVYADVVRDGRIWWEPFDSHQLFLGLAVEQGLVGLVLFGVGLVAVARRTTRRHPWPLAVVATFVLNGVTEVMTLRPTVSLVALVAAATVATPVPAAPPGPPVRAYAAPRTRRRRSPSAAAHPGGAPSTVPRPRDPRG